MLEGDPEYLRDLAVSIIEKIKLVFKAKAVADEAEKAQKAGTMDKTWRTLLHILAMMAPLAGAVIVEQLGKALGASDDHLLAAVGVFLGSIVPLLRRVGGPEDREGS